MEVIPGFIYVRTPKTASVSTVFTLSKMFRKVIQLDAAFMKFEDLPPLNVLKSADLIVVTEVWAKLLRATYPGMWLHRVSFAVSRNPYDKCISAWKYCSSTKENTLKFNLLNAPSTDSNWHDYVHFTRSQTDSLAENGKLIVDRILRFEDLDSEFKRFCLLHNFPVVSLPHVNKTKGRSNHTTLPLEDVELINKMYDQDFLILNYKKYHSSITI